MKQEVIKILMEFLKKATGDNATLAEIAVIPQVAALLLRYGADTSVPEQGTHLDGVAKRVNKWFA